MLKMSASALLLLALSALHSQVTSGTVIITNKVWTPFTDRPANFERIDKNEACDEVTPGIRYWKKGDPTLIRIEDDQGNFVGTHTGRRKYSLFTTDVHSYATVFVPATPTKLMASNKGSAIFKSAILEVVPPEHQLDTVNWYENNAQVQVEEIDGEVTYLMTGYIFDPSQICSRPQTQESTDLYIKHNGPDAVDGYLKVCRSDRSVENEGWEINPCVPTMGDHYRFKVPAVDDPDCKDWTPIFLLFVGQKCVGYGWNFRANIPTINFEHPPRDKFQGAITPMPDCVMKSFDDSNGYSSEHVYLVDNPQGIKCPSS